MADFVQVVVQVDKSQLKSLQTDVTKLNGKTVKIDVDATGITAAKNEIVKLSKTFDEQGNLKKSVTDVELAFGRMERTIETVGKKGTTVTTTLTNDLKAQAQAAKGAEVAYAKYAAEVAKDSKAIVTPLQQQINATTGVSREFKSATDSAKYFMLRGLTPAEKALNEGAVAAKGAGASIKTFGNALEETSKKATGLKATLDQYINWYLRWTLVSGAFQAGINGITNALKTMKAVDDELVTVRKVTGFTEEQLKQVEEQAYKTASAYGVSADAYLESVAAFARAGYKDQSAALAELSTKTQIVGDTTAETANQFLLSVDAAYKYNGSIKDLTAVLDGANEIDNRYATSIEKIAEGLGKVAPIAAQTHVDISELAAAIGTITAVTQRSGTEAATALRALFLNIVGDTKTEIEEGVTWTTGEIAGLRDVIKTYSKEAYEAAQAKGAVIDPMEAIGGLAKSMKEGLLTEQELMSMVSDIGGKLRTSQLLALIQNWDMYQSMLQDYAGAIGSADKEVENALDSWTRKTAQLSNAWTEFISHLVDSKEVKVALDIITAAIKLLDSDFTKLAITVGLATVAISLLSKAYITLSGTAIAGVVTELVSFMTTAAAATGWALTLKATLTALGAALIANPLTWVAAIGAAFYGVIKLADKLNVTYEEQNEILKELEQQYESTYGVGSELDQLKNKEEELTEREKKRLAILEAEADELHRQVLEQQKLTYKTWAQEQTSEEYVSDGDRAYWVTHDLTAEKVKQVRDAYVELSFAFDRGKKSAAEYKDELQQQVIALKDDYEAIMAGKEAGEQLTPAQEALVAIFDLLTGKLADVTIAIKNETNATKQAQQPSKTLAELMKETEDSLNTEADAATNAAMQTQFYALQAALASGQPIDTASAISSLSGLSAQSTNTAAALQALIAVFQQIESLDAQIESYTEKAANTTGRRGQMYASRMGTLASQRAGFDVSGAFQKAYSEALANMPKDGGGGGGGGRSSATKSPEELLAEEQEAELERLKQIVSDEKARYELMVKQGASADELKAQAIVIQTALHDQAEYMRSIGSDYSDVASLSKEWYDWEEKKAKLDEEAQKAKLQEYEDTVSALKNQLSFLEASDASEGERIAKMREIQTALHDQAEYMRSIKADEEEIRKLSTEWWKIQKDINKELKAIVENAEKLAKEYQDALVDAFNDLADQVETANEAATASLRQQLDLLEAQRDARKATNEETEKLLAVEKARIALENAQRERKIRQYNARTGQWEWVADAQAVQSAQEALSNANEALYDFREQQQIDALKSRIDIINTAHDELKSAIEYVADAIKSGAMTYQEAYAYIDTAMRGIYNNYGIDLTGILGATVGGFQSVYNATQALYDNIISQMKANSEAWWAAANSGNAVLAGQYADANAILGAALGLTRDADGYWRDANGNVVYTPAGTPVTTTTGTSGSSTPHVSASKEALATGNAQTIAQSKVDAQKASHLGNTGTNSTAMTPNQKAAAEAKANTSNTKSSFKKYDSGGILSGLGGIKATAADEMILPPDATMGLLSAEKNGVFDALLNHLGIVTAVGESYGGFNRGLTSNIGEMHNGDIWYLNGFEMNTINQSTTLGEVARLAKNLKLQAG